ncbi:endo-1,3(4)-beta-glucanase 1 [Magnaporthiopsis poae ATCC 64411]|uniref:glucan endo-1,3-beta-D-glucosidase n=1 Tax=Magnaporthiopsis poae (strain ATCC 64411 / 73-15) TaxID=644358 RepID=A0A0C4EEC4_MAGP6|nr:endo-1,3(4)-beta-glucanase 1 [Magnaporthiopsis poae ATCC 64411]
MLWYIGLILLQAASCSAEPVLNHQGHHRHRHTARDSPPEYTSPDPAGLFSSTAPSPQPVKTVLPGHITTLSGSTKSSSLDTYLPTSTIPVITRLVEAGIEQIALNPTPGPPLGASGTIITTLNTTGQATQPRLLPPVLTTEPTMVFSFLNKSSKQPVNRIAAGPQPESNTPENQSELGSLSIDSESQYEDAVSELGFSPVMLLTAERVVSTNVFAQPISGGAAPPAFFERRQDHPVPRTGIASPTPLATNKFYSNLYLGGLRSPVYLHPYALHWVKGQGVTKSWGMSISHVEASQRVFGPTDPTTGASRFFINPIHIESLILSATDLGATTALTMAQMTAFSAMAELRPNNRALPSVRIPLVQGSAFITGVYQGSIPVIGTGVHFKTITRALKAPKPGVVKYKIILENGATWLLYARNMGGVPLDLQIRNSKTAVSTSAFHGTIQIAKDPGNGAAVYDQACGAYATSTELSGTVKGTVGSYTLTFKKQGLTSSPLLMFALPHMVASFNGATTRGVTPLRLQTTTKGIAAGVLGDSWTVEEKSLPTDMGFLPWLPGKGTLVISSKAKAAILPIARSEIAQDMSAQSNLDSMYFSGKALAKFATILIAVNDMLGDKQLAQAGLKKLKDAYARFAENRQKFPLFYESAWGGVVSSASYVTGNPGVDFGNTYYNDHHFHYGYFVYTAAVIAKLDKVWGSKNRDFVNTLVRDYANPSAKDKFFPVYRNFDWYHGHSWAHGLYDTLDGNDQESSSEDAMSAYAIKMWGWAIGDRDMEARGNLQLATLARSLRYYYLYTSDNNVQPAQFIGNKVAGILFENKIDHTTFFGNNIEYIQGIHMIPLLPFAPLCRSNRFVDEEWQAYFSKGRIDSIPGGWRGILIGNLAHIDAKRAFGFFSSNGFDASHLDGGASRTWYMAYSAALGGL